MRTRLPFIVSAVFHYLGPAFAVLLFVRVDVLGVAWLRIASAAVVFALWRRPWHLLRDRDVLAWGAVLAVMNPLLSFDSWKRVKEMWRAVKEAWIPGD